MKIYSLAKYGVSSVNMLLVAFYAITIFLCSTFKGKHIHHILNKGVYSNGRSINYIF